MEVFNSELHESARANVARHRFRFPKL